MRKLSFISVVVVLLLGVFFWAFGVMPTTSVVSASKGRERQIREASEAWDEAFNAEDLDALMALYAELIDTDVTVSVALPGAMNTGIAQRSGAAMAADAGSSRMPVLAPDRAAQILLRGVEKDRLHIYVGRDARLMDLAVRIAPRRAIGAVQRQIKALLGPQIGSAAQR